MGPTLHVYVCQTDKTLEYQQTDHRWPLTGGNLAQSAVAEHVAHESRATDWKKRLIKVVDTCALTSCTDTYLSGCMEKLERPEQGHFMSVE